MITCICLSNCEVNVQKSVANESNFTASNGPTASEFSVDFKTIKGMEYMFVNSYYGGSTIINLTQDSLQIEVLKKQLNKK